MIAFLRRLFGRESDTAWKPTGYSYRHTGTDEATAVASVERGDKLAESRRKLAALRAKPRQVAKVEQFPDRRAR